MARRRRRSWRHTRPTARSIARGRSAPIHRSRSTRAPAAWTRRPTSLVLSSEALMMSRLRQTRTLLSIAALVLLCSAGALAQSRWMKAAPFPEPDEELYGVSAGGKMYVIGGFGGGRG